MMRLILLLQLISNYLYANPLRLFNQNGTPVEVYDELVIKIRDNVQIQFSNGEIFTIKEKLGSGDDFIVFSVTEYPEHAIRIVKSKYRIYEVNEYYLAMNKANKLQLPVIQVLGIEPGQWVATKIASKNINLANFIREVSYRGSSQIEGQNI